MPHLGEGDNSANIGKAVFYSVVHNLLNHF